MYQQTSKEVYQAIQPKLPSLRQQVLNVVKTSGERGLTIEEIREKLPEARLDSVNPRLAELSVRGLVSHHGFRRNSRGRKMLVWVATQLA